MMIGEAVGVAVVVRVGKRDCFAEIEVIGVMVVDTIAVGRISAGCGGGVFEVPENHAMLIAPTKTAEAMMRRFIPLEVAMVL